MKCGFVDIERFCKWRKKRPIWQNPWPCFAHVIRSRVHVLVSPWIGATIAWRWCVGTNIIGNHVNHGRLLWDAGVLSMKLSKRPLSLPSANVRWNLSLVVDRFYENNSINIPLDFTVVAEWPYITPENNMLNIKVRNSGKEIWFGTESDWVHFNSTSWKMDGHVCVITPMSPTPAEAVATNGWQPPTTILAYYQSLLKYNGPYRNADQFVQIAVKIYCGWIISLMLTTSCIGNGLWPMPDVNEGSAM